MTDRPAGDRKGRVAWGSIMLVWVALVLLLALTLWLAFVPLGRFNFPIALSIAALQAVLVGAFSMELKDAKGYIHICAAVGFFWIAIMFGLTFVDLAVRH